MERRGLKGFALAATLAALSLAASGPHAGAALTLGQLAPTTSGAGDCAGADHAQLHVAANTTNYKMLETGTITTWSHNAAPGGAQQLTMKVLRNVGDPHLFDYQVVGLDGPRDLEPGRINTFSTSVAVRTGDILGLNASSAATACTFPADPVDTILTFPGFLNIGQTGTFADTGDADGSRLNLSGVLEPSNVVGVGTTTRNKKKGTATLNLNLPNPGDLSASGKGVSAASAGLARTSTYYELPGSIQVPVHAKGKQKRTLIRTGKVKLKVRLTYTPINGAPGTQAVKVNLKKKL